MPRFYHRIYFLVQIPFLNFHENHFSIQDDHNLRLHNLDLPVGKIVTAFVENGLEVSEAHTCEESLEDYFKRCLLYTSSAGFIIEECQESKVPESIREKRADMFGGVIHQPDFIFFRCGKKN